MKPASPLHTKFQIDRTSIKLTDDRIGPEEFSKAIEEYLDLIHNHSFKLGDLLHQFREQFPGQHQTWLIPKLIAEREQTRKLLEMVMSLAQHFAPRERYDELDQTHYHELQSLRDEDARADIVAHIRSEVQAGKKVPALIVRNMVRDAKLTTGQGLRPNRGKPRVHPLE